jgi:uncharacterized protein YkwD
MDTGFFGASRPRHAVGRLARSALRLVATVTTTAVIGSPIALTAVTSAEGAGADSPGPQITTGVTTTPPTHRVAGVTLSDYERRVQRLINKRRTAHDLRRLRLADCPETTAKRWSRHLARSDEFYHQSMTDLLDKCDAVYAGETLGRGSMTPRKLVRMWMESEGHRAVLLSRKSRRIGIGASVMADGRHVVAANFIRF